MEENSQQHLPQQNESIISNVQAGLARKNSRGVSPSSYTQLPGSGGSGNSSASNIIPIAPGGGSGGVSGNNSSNYSINALANVNKSLATLDAKKEVASALSSNNLEAAALSSSAADNVWQIICVRVLPLFNGEGVKGCVEDLNELVR